MIGDERITLNLMNIYRYVTIAVMIVTAIAQDRHP